ncbi:hypothetical protein [Rhizobium ruizarguesonis]|uniref:hypothetical protein n=1 Tax=Rhizobium ruizarguesonis TaxID=2081791 RepID=UPI001030A66B|nr:hypothetical protein [Rhizobium ruizarguesonis]TBE87719.1 hypothetical protein ELG99_13125 [Rhizobium ruizarguesonis]
MENISFDFADIRKRLLSKAVWVPLRASEIVSDGEPGRAGWKEEFFGLGSVAIPVAKRGQAEKIGWQELSNSQGVWASEKLYKPADVFQRHEGEDLGVSLVLTQDFETDDQGVWHLNQDVVLALGLVRDGDLWLRPSEDYQEVARLRRRHDGRPNLLEMKNEFLRDYLCARQMLLRTAMFRSRSVIVKDLKEVGSPVEKKEQTELDEYELRHLPQIEGGFGGDGAYSVFRIGRTDVDPDEDVPTPGPGTDQNTESISWSARHTGQQVICVMAELWRTENIEPAEASIRIRGDHVPSGIAYITDASGATTSSEDLNDEEKMRWLWFRPEVIPNIMKRRGGSLRWYTRMTGGIGFTVSNLTHFGVNKVDLINVYAYDIAKLPVWQQRIWAGYNVAPEGGVSDELVSAQARAIVAETTGPEAQLSKMLPSLDNLFKKAIGSPLFRSHAESDDLLATIHRFRGLEHGGVLSLAKDIMRLLADRMDVGALQAAAPPPKGVTWGSLKSLEKYLGTIITQDDARKMMGPLLGAYNLRIADAHLSSKELTDAFRLAQVDPDASRLEQGMQLLSSVCGTIDQIGKIMTEVEENKHQTT